MEFEERKLHTVIASEQYLVRLGVKTLLNVIGIESDLHEVGTFDELEYFLQKDENMDYLILSEDILQKQRKPDCLEYVKNSFGLNTTILIGKQQFSNCVCDHFISNSCSRKEVVDKLQQFFYAPKANEQQEEDSHTLSDREKDVLKAVALGFSNKEIADQLFISINTVITHRKNITSKLGIKTISGLTVYALMHHIIKAEEAM
ncbi:LuxR C-terminal-related transcriptional regulator [Marinifilum flexuosum]|uniref:DNA-binding NarL/FixJ family response regulator n=1 Tax=Marinifilum flexuosum TaxID=1117708 RepID=A0A419WSZ0_9BACT|nr:response regulator transcription factor [Marinifilum flexuosum]RKD98552.1 DNA-binding NarL/FixJ family response regulator [Marinifilum flexuosum]